jgi:hypothetical protein
VAIGTHLTKTECVLVRFRIANGHKVVQHAFCQGLVHVFGDWNDGHSSVKVAKIPLHFPVERRRAREAEAAKQGIGFYVPRPQLCLVVKIAPPINISTSSSSSWLIS